MVLILHAPWHTACAHPINRLSISFSGSCHTPSPGYGWEDSHALHITRVRDTKNSVTNLVPHISSQIPCAYMCADPAISKAAPSVVPSAVPSYGCPWGISASLHTISRARPRPAVRTRYDFGHHISASCLYDSSMFSCRSYQLT